MRVASEWSDKNQVKSFKYLGVTFTSDGRQDEELDTRIGKASTVHFALFGWHEMRIVEKGKALNFQNSFSLHESWVMNLG